MSRALSDRLAGVASKRPRDSALRTLDGDWSWADVASGAGQVRAELERAGVPARSFVLTVGAQSPLVLLAVFGAEMHGAIPAVVDGRDPALLADTVAMLAPAAVVCLAGISPPSASPTVIAVRVEATRLGFETVIREGRPRATAVDGSGLAVFSSGTTAAPKATVWSEPRLRAMFAGAPPWGAHERRCVGLVRSLGFAGDLLHALSALGSGTPVAILNPLIAAAPAFGAMAQLGVTHFTCTPVQVQRILRDRISAPACLRSVRVTGAGISAATLLAFRAFVGAATLSKSYGLAETGVVSVLAAADLLDRPDSSGRIVPGCWVSVVDASGAPLAPGAEGAIVVHLDTHTGADGYWAPEPSLAASFRDGVLTTHDTGALDGKGFLTITGRASEVLKVAGQSVSLVRVEAALRQEESGTELAVVGVPHARDSEVPAVIYVPSDRAEEEESLRRAAARVLTGAAVPRWYLPRRELAITPAGKLDRGGMAREASRYSEPFSERVAAAGRLWPAHWIADDAASRLLLVDGGPAAPPPMRVLSHGARAVSVARPEQPWQPLVWASIQDGLDLATSGVRVVLARGLAMASVPDCLVEAVVAAICDAALRLPGHRATAVVVRADNQRLRRSLLSVGFVAAASGLVWQPSPSGVEPVGAEEGQADRVALVGRIARALERAWEDSA
jgi:acyl-CoA synthetase (AMP-forming)/AMP-acid ligase II